VFVKVKTIANEKQLYCNANWNWGVEEATGDYIAIINADIDFLTPNWDVFLIQNIDKGYEIANPYQSDPVHPTAYMKPPPEDLIYHLNIRGACFMLQGQFARRVFPIPKELVHWCGDNYISWNCKNWIYDIRVNIYHHISKSGEKVDQRLFWNMVEGDVSRWMEMKKDDTMEPIRQMCQARIRSYS
jgi:glycosyltransferase involved in cell wall biosynthesis